MAHIFCLEQYNEVVASGFLCHYLLDGMFFVLPSLAEFGRMANLRLTCARGTAILQKFEDVLAKRSMMYSDNSSKRRNEKKI